MKEDINKNIAQSILDTITKENIQSYTHCSTRFRVHVINPKVVDKEQIKKIDKVMGVVINNNEIQIILGPGVVNKVYNEFSQIYDSAPNNLSAEKADTMMDKTSIAKTGNSAKKQNNDFKTTSTIEDQKKRFRAGNNIVLNKMKFFIKELASVFVSIIPGIVATGLFLGLKGLFLGEAFLGLFNTTPEQLPKAVTAIATVLTDTVFASLPALICWSSFKKWGGTPVIGFVVGLMLVNPILPNAYSVANGEVDPIYLFKFIPLIGYQGSILTSIMAGFVGAKTEKFFRRVMPESLDLMLTPFIAILAAVIGGLLFFGPILHYFEEGLVWVVTQSLKIKFGIGGLIIGGLYPISVLVGMHHLFFLIETTLLGSTGFNPIITICSMFGFANAAVCFAITTRAPKNVKAVGISAGITQILGVSEPALFGLTIRYGSKPFVIVVLSSAIGGAFLSIMGIQANSYGLAVILSPLMYTYSMYQLLTYILTGIGLFAITYVVTLLIGIPKEIKRQSKIESKSKKTNLFDAKLVDTKIADLKSKTIRKEPADKIHKEKIKQKSNK